MRMSDRSTCNLAHLTPLELFHLSAFRFFALPALLVIITRMKSGADWISLASWLALLVCVVTSLMLTPTPLPTQTPTPTAPPTLTPEPVDTGWLPVTLGMERRHVTVSTDLGNERVTMIRLDPTQFTLRVRVTPGEADTVQAWSTATDALLTFNAGYFDEDNQPLGLHIADRERYGSAYGDFAGMFAVTADQETSVRWLRDSPYDPQEALTQAVQSFPMLVKPGGIMGFPADADEGHVSRRTVIAQDTAGRLLILVAPRGYFSLHELAQWLVASNLEIDAALNLDGGKSSGLWLAETPVAQIDSLVSVPAVITID